MGLDGVELVMKVEDRFRIKLSDLECAQVRTVADLAAVVISRLEREPGVCPTSRAFFELRRQMVRIAGVECRHVRPCSRLEALFSSGLRRNWRKLREANPRLPRLVAPPSLDTALLWASGIGVFVSVGVAGVTWARYGAGAGVGAFMLVALAMSMLLLVWNNIGWRLPNGVETVGDLVRAVSPMELADGSSGERLLARLRVVEEVRRITASQLGLELEKVRPESEFVKDLGVD